MSTPLPSSPTGLGEIPAWKSEAKYRTLFESIDEGFCVIEVRFDAGGKAFDYVFLEANPAFERQTGLVDAIGRNMLSIAPTHEEHWFNTYGEVARSGKPVRFEAPAQALARWYDVYAFRVGEPDQCLVAVLFNDVSTRKELERSIERQNMALREADRRKDRFLATLSHELRNPLAPLKVAADLLGRTGLTEKQLDQTREIIRRQVGHMARLLDDLLDIARITQGKLTLRRQRVRPMEFIDSALESVRPLIERRQHFLDVELEANPPPVDADPVRMSQVVANLLGNAAKYTDAGGRITLATRAEGEAFVIEVRDNGIGIAPEALPGLFEMFSQQPGASDRSEGGLGIGLSLVRGLMDLHGGSVHVASPGPGSGSTFTVRVPFASGGGGEEEGPRPAAPGHDRRKILVADDNRDAAEALAMLLDHLGHEVRVAFDGHSALSVARTFQPDVAVLDIGMPKLNGYEVAKALRREPWAAALLLVAATGWGDADARRTALEAGFDKHLTKPLGPEELQEIVARAGR